MFGEVRGKAAVATSWQRMFSGFEDIALTVSEVFVEGDRIAIMGTIDTTDTRGWFGLPPTGARIGYRIVIRIDVADGRIVRDERIYDLTNLLGRLEKLRIDRELQTAAEVQRALMARDSFTSAFARSVGNSLPCRTVGGDFFEFFELPGGAAGIVVGDVAGKGPAAALLAAMIQGMFAAETANGDGPAATLGRINRRLAARRIEPRFATVVYGVLAPDGRFTYCNAGHNAPIVLAGGEVHRLDVGGPILGAFPDAGFQEASFRFDRGDTLVMFSDGVSEASNSAGEEFGEARLLTCIQQNRAATPEALLAAVFAEIRNFCGGAEQLDDITATVTQFQ
jgi:phosphoserine phosphatase RsbU/P